MVHVQRPRRLALRAAAPGGAEAKGGARRGKSAGNVPRPMKFKASALVAPQCCAGCTGPMAPRAIWLRN